MGGEVEEAGHGSRANACFSLEDDLLGKKRQRRRQCWRMWRWHTALLASNVCLNDRGLFAFLQTSPSLLSLSFF